MQHPFETNFASWLFVLVIFIDHTLFDLAITHYVFNAIALGFML